MKMIVFLLLFCINLTAADYDLSDARSVALGGTSVFMNNASSAWLNPSQLCAVTNKEIDLSCELLYLGLDSRVYTGDTDYFDSLRLSLALPLGKMRLGFGYFQFFSSYFRDSKFRVTFAEQMGRLDLGINLKYMVHDYEKNDYTALNPFLAQSSLNAQNIGLDAGVRAELVRETIWLSFSLVNINQPDMGVVGEDRLDLAAFFEAGIKISRFLFSPGLEYRAGKIDRLALGMETTILSSSLPLRMGFDNSFLPCIGLGVRIKEKPFIGIDYAARFFSGMEGNLGSHYFTVFVKF